MNELRAAIFQALSTDGPLVALVGSRVFHQRVPLNTPTPYVVFSRPTGTPTWTFAGPPVQGDLWLVKAVDEAQSASVAEDAAAAIDSALAGAALPMVDRIAMDVRRTSDVSYAEAQGLDTYFHEGAMYRIATTATDP